MLPHYISEKTCSHHHCGASTLMASRPMRRARQKLLVLGNGNAYWTATRMRKRKMWKMRILTKTLISAKAKRIIKTMITTTLITVKATMILTEAARAKVSALHDKAESRRRRTVR